MILTILLVVFMVLWFISLFPVAPLAAYPGWLAFICVLLIALGARLPIHGMG
jgi:hypothetical protein